MSGTPHGSLAAWNQHMRGKQHPCGPCQAAHAGYVTGWRHRRKVAARVTPRCGRELGLIAHKIAHEPACAACLAWGAAYERALSVRRVTP